MTFSLSAIIRPNNYGTDVPNIITIDGWDPGVELDEAYIVNHLLKENGIFVVNLPKYFLDDDMLGSLADLKWLNILQLTGPRLEKDFFAMILPTHLAVNSGVIELMGTQSFFSDFYPTYEYLCNHLAWLDAVLGTVNAPKINEWPLSEVNLNEESLIVLREQILSLKTRDQASHKAVKINPVSKENESDDVVGFHYKGSFDTPDDKATWVNVDKCFQLICDKEFNDLDDDSDFGRSVRLEIVQNALKATV